MGKLLLSGCINHVSPAHPFLAFDSVKRSAVEFWMESKKAEETSFMRKTSLQIYVIYTHTHRAKSRIFVSLCLYPWNLVWFFRGRYCMHLYGKIMINSFLPFDRKRWVSLKFRRAKIVFLLVDHRWKDQEHLDFCWSQRHCCSQCTLLSLDRPLSCCCFRFSRLLSAFDCGSVLVGNEFLIDSGGYLCALGTT